MKNVLVVLIVLVLTSCSSSNDVVRNGFLQKRKYKKGYNLSFKKKGSKEGKEKINEPDIAETKLNEIEYIDTISINEPIVIPSEKETVLATTESQEFIHVKSVLEKILIESKKENERKEVVGSDEKKESKGDGSKTLGVILIVLGLLITFVGFIALTANITILFYLGLLALAIGLLLFTVGNGTKKTTNTKIDADNNKEDKEVKTEEKEFPIVSLLFTIGMFVLLVGAVLTGVGFAAMLLKEVEVLFALGVSIVSLAALILLVSAVLGAAKSLRKPVAKVTKKKQEKIKNLTEEEKVQIQEKNEKRTLLLSNVFTWATAIFPLFIVPALVLNIFVIIQSKDNKKKKNNAIWRLVALPFLLFIGTLVTLSILEGAGIITSTP